MTARDYALALAIGAAIGFCTAISVFRWLGLLRTREEWFRARVRDDGDDRPVDP